MRDAIRRSGVAELPGVPALVDWSRAVGRSRTGRFLLGAILTILLAFLGYRWIAGVASPSMELYEVVSGDVTIRISERGELRALQSVTISAAEDDLITYLIPEGTYVKAGDLLIEFDTGKYEMDLESSQAALNVTEADLRKAEKDLDAQREKLEADAARYESELRLALLELEELKSRPLPDELARAKIDLEKAQLAFENAKKRQEVLPQLVEKGFVTVSALEEAQLEFLEAKAQLQSAQFTHDKVAAGATPQELERAQIRVDQARTALEKARNGMRSQMDSYQAAIDREHASVQRAKNLISEAEQSVASTRITAPRDGLVVYAKASPDSNSTDKVQLGMIPFEGQPLLYLPDLSTMVVDIEVHEVDIGKIQIGSPAQVQLEAYPGAVFNGQVSRIGSLAKQKQGATASGVKAFDVTVRIDEQDPRLKPGLSAEVDVLVEHDASGSIAVPLRAVTVVDGTDVVYVYERGRVRRRPVTLGLSNDTSIIVKDGLQPGERVVLDPPAVRP